jgi:hypothetical protein
MTLYIYRIRRESKAQCARIATTLTAKSHVVSGDCVRGRTEQGTRRAYIAPMDWIAAVTEWKAFRNEVGARWQQLTDSQLDAIAGMRIRLAEQIRASYDVTADEAERQICNFEARNQYLRAVSSR